MTIRLSYNTYRQQGMTEIVIMMKIMLTTAVTTMPNTMAMVMTMTKTMLIWGVVFNRFTYFKHWHSNDMHIYRVWDIVPWASSSLKLMDSRLKAYHSAYGFDHYPYSKLGAGLPEISWQNRPLVIVHKEAAMESLIDSEAQYHWIIETNQNLPRAVNMIMCIVLTTLVKTHYLHPCITFTILKWVGCGKGKHNQSHDDMVINCDFRNVNFVHRYEVQAIYKIFLKNQCVANVVPVCLEYFFCWDK